MAAKCLNVGKFKRQFSKVVILLTKIKRIKQPTIIKDED